MKAKLLFLLFLPLTLWGQNEQEVYYDFEDDFSIFNTIIQLDDGDFIVGGGASTGISGHARVARISSAGEMLWEHSLPNCDSFSQVFDVIITSNGNIAFSGFCSSIGFLLFGEIDVDGNEIWSEAMDASVTWGQSLIEIDDGHYFSIGHRVMEVVEQEMSVTSYLPPDQMFYMEENEGLIYTYGTSGNTIYLKCLGSDMEVLWIKDYDDFKIRNASNNCMDITSDGAVLMVGEHSSTPDGFLLKTNAQGDSLWVRTYPDYEWLTAVEERENGNIVISGRSAEGRVMISELDSNGNVICNHEMGESESYWPRSLALKGEHGAAVVGTRWISEFEICNAFFMSVDSICGTTTHVGSHSSAPEHLLYPVPARDILTLELSNAEPVNVEISDLSGAVVKKERGTHYLRLDVSDLPAGLYIMRISQADREEVYKKFIVE